MSYNTSIKLNYKNERFFKHTATDVSACHDAVEAMLASNLYWETLKEGLSAGTDYRYIKTHRALTRSDNGDILNVVEDSYMPIQNRDVAEFAYGMARSMSGTVTRAFGHDTRNGSLGGRIGFVVNLGSFDVENNKMDKRLIISDSKGDGGLNVLFDVSREVCKNGMRTYSKEFTTRYTIKHTRFCKNRLDEIGKLHMPALQYYNYLEATYQKLVNQPFTFEQMQDLAVRVFPKTKDKETGQLILTEKTRNKRLELIDRWKFGAEHEELRETAYRAYCAVTEYVDHKRTIPVTKGRNAESVAYENIMIGGGDKFKQRAFEYLTEGLVTV